MDKKVLYALTTKIFNTLKKLGIKPKIGVTTGVKRLPGSRNSFNTDLSKLEGGNPEALKKLIANDADFLPQATADEIAQYNNNLEYLKSTYPDIFKQPETAINAKTGVKTLVDDVNEKAIVTETPSGTVDDVEITTIDREPNADGGLTTGLGTMFRKRGR